MSARSKLSERRETISSRVRPSEFKALFASFLLVLGAQGALANQRATLHDPTLESKTRSPGSKIIEGRSMVDEGMTCVVIDFEGIGNLSPIPEFDGITSPDWLAIIDADAGGTGNIAFEPSPSTIAFWLGGDPSRRILFDEPVAKVEFKYASAVPVLVEAFDEDDVLIESVVGPVNFDQGPGGDPGGSYNKWDPLSIESSGNSISSVRVSGEEDQTGIDDLTVCEEVRVHSVEVTQAIQEWQMLEELKADLAADGEPPVPILADKAAVLRVFMNEIQSVTDVRIDLEIPGVTSGTQELALQPKCTPLMSRQESGGCEAVEFFFTPPDGSWTAMLSVFDEQDDLIEEHELAFESRNADELVLLAVSVCDSETPSGWECSSAADVAGLTNFLVRTAPAEAVRVEVTNHVVRRDADDYDADANGVLDRTEASNWWTDVGRDVDNLYGLWDAFLDLFGEERYYYGVVRPNAPGSSGGLAHDIPSRGAASRSSVIRLGVETADEVLAHETGHMLGRRHTNKMAPAAGGSPPGCYGLATDSSTDWPYLDNHIQSATRREVGFDLANSSPVDPETHFDWMSYCSPRWISPHTYRGGLLGFGTSRTRLADLAGAEAGEFWAVSGVIEESGVAMLDPLFVFMVEASSDSGSGTHSIEVRDSDGEVLFVRQFVPAEPFTETDEDESEISPKPVFFELVPHDVAADSIVILNEKGTEIGVYELGGSVPEIAMIFPLGGEDLGGVQSVAWSISDPDSSDHSSRLDYSWDDGLSWATIGETSLESLLVDFDDLPGTDGSGLLRLHVSDGAQSATLESAQFGVTSKNPSAEILQPTPDSVFQQKDLIWLTGSAFDQDDGFLDGDVVTWESSRDGDLGSGASLETYDLSPGRHDITLTVRDSDGNIANATETLTIAGAPPEIELEVVALDTLPTTCVQVTVDASAARDGLDPNSVEVSLDGGTSWDVLDLERLPHRFIVEGSGFFHLVARALDETGQASVDESRFFVETECSTDQPPFVSITEPRNNAEFDTASAITLAGFATDFPDGDLTSALTWRSNLSGSLGAGGVVSTTLPPGPHSVTSRVVDSAALAGSDSIRLVITSPGCPADVTLAGVGVDGVEVVRAVNTVDVRDVDVRNTGSLTLIANQSVVLGDGFSVGSGGSLEIALSDDPCN